jgi:dTDP-4-amino-4,6-dideoxygalactose transaminase
MANDNLKPRRIYLSPPHLEGDELEFVRDALESNWVAPVGPHVDAFEQEVAELLGVPYAVALSSGTAAIHLALRGLKVGPGDEVLCSALTFVASANPIVYEGGQPVFIDCDRATWTIDPNALEEELRASAARGCLPKAVIAVDLYGQCADYNRIHALCAEYGVALIEDAAEALGATYQDRMAGSFGDCGVLSFNGNKIITTSGGGMLLSRDRSLIEQARFLAKQARDSAPHFNHTSVGYTYRMSNVLAAIGRAQLRLLGHRVEARRRNYCAYREALEGLPGIEFMPHAAYGRPNYWLTCVLINPQLFGATRDDLRLALEAENIESRPVWKPMHLQPVFAGCRFRGSGVSESIFEQGLCLPSGSNLGEYDLRRIVEIVRGVGAATSSAARLENESLLVPVSNE